jgi:hypothetical protein
MISQAVSQKFSRPIAESRANAQPTDIAPKVETVRVSLWGKFSSKIIAALGALGFTGSTVPQSFTWAKETFQPVQDAFNTIPGSVWFLAVVLVAVGAWYVTDRAAKAATKDYNTGKLN